MKKNHITVQGTGRLHIVPDVTRVILKLVSLHDSYNEAYEQGTENSAALGKIMTEAKLPTTLPKTNRFDIDKKFEQQYDSYGHYTNKTKFVGYELSHQVKIDLDMNKETLNTIVKSVGRHLKQAEIEIGYTLKDPRPIQLKTVERAVKDAKEKAMIIANAGGCSLGNIISIEYGEKEIHIYAEARTFHDCAEAYGCTPNSIDIEPDDLVVNDKVSVTWEIINKTDEQ